MRRQAFKRALMVGLLGAGLLGGCHDRPERCHAAYDHLSRLAQHQEDQGLARRFVDACVAAWDEGRVTCLLAARTADEALACKPVKIRPG